MDSVRCVLTLENAADLDINTLNANGAYLNGILKKTIYMWQPSEYNNRSSQVCLLKKTLYGLKHSGHKWHEELDQTFAEESFVPLDADRCIYVKEEGEKIWIMPVHIDNMLSTTMLGDGEMLK